MLSREMAAVNELAVAARRAENDLSTAALFVPEHAMKSAHSITRDCRVLIAWCEGYLAATPDRPVDGG